MPIDPTNSPPSGHDPIHSAERTTVPFLQNISQTKVVSQAQVPQGLRFTS